MNKTTLRHQELDRSNKRLPYWRLVPCSLAIVALAWIPGYTPAPQNPPEPHAAVTLVAYQEQAPAVQQQDTGTDSESNEGTALPSPEALIKAELKKEMSQEEIAAADIVSANEIVIGIAPVDWLGPLAPVALSPFFGITCLSGMAIWAPDWIPGNTLINASTPLKDQNLFIVFAVLTVVTSIPRFSKVSKPIGQAIDQVEAYAGIITLVAIRFMASHPESGGMMDSNIDAQAGVAAFSADALLYIAMIVNVIVINSIKFFFEFMIWLTPVPLLDACFELLNKAICGALLMLYAFSPTLALVVNLSMFLACLLILRWANRFVKFYRLMIFDSLWSLINEKYAQPQNPELTVFPKRPWAGFASKACLKLSIEDESIRLTESRLFRTPTVVELPRDTRISIQKGLLANTLCIDSDDSVEMTFSRRYQNNLDALAEVLGAELDDSAGAEESITAKTEFA